MFLSSKHPQGEVLGINNMWYFLNIKPLLRLWSVYFYPPFYYENLQTSGRVETIVQWISLYSLPRFYNLDFDLFVLSSIHLSICPSVHPFIYSFTRLLIYLSVYLSIYLSTMYLSTYPSIHLFILLSIY